MSSTKRLPTQSHTAHKLPPVSFSEYRGVRHLHLGTPWVQGSMRLSKPNDLELVYVQRMMAGALFLDDPVPANWRGLHAMQLGLGAGALSKFCLHHLTMRCTAVEINPEVLRACQAWFKLPTPNQVLQGEAPTTQSTAAPWRVCLDSAETVLAQPQCRGSVDLLHVDLYDHQAASPVLDSEAFYAQCRSVLTTQGSMAVNLFGRSHSFAHSLRKITRVFGAACVWQFPPTLEGNTVVVARAQPVWPNLDASNWQAEITNRAQGLAAATGLKTKHWPRLFSICASALP